MQDEWQRASQPAPAEGPRRADLVTRPPNVIRRCCFDSTEDAGPDRFRHALSMGLLCYNFNYTCESGLGLC